MNTPTPEGHAQHRDQRLPFAARRWASAMASGSGIMAVRRMRGPYGRGRVAVGDHPAHRPGQPEADRPRRGIIGQPARGPPGADIDRAARDRVRGHAGLQRNTWAWPRPAALGGGSCRTAAGGSSSASARSATTMFTSTVMPISSLVSAAGRPPPGRCAWRCRPGARMLVTLAANASPGNASARIATGAPRFTCAMSRSSTSAATRSRAAEAIVNSAALAGDGVAGIDHAPHHDAVQRREDAVFLQLAVRQRHRRLGAVAFGAGSAARPAIASGRAGRHQLSGRAPVPAPPAPGGPAHPPAAAAPGGRRAARAAGRAARCRPRPPAARGDTAGDGLPTRAVSIASTMPVA